MHTYDKDTIMSITSYSTIVESAAPVVPTALKNQQVSHSMGFSVASRLLFPGNKISKEHL